MEKVGPPWQSNGVATPEMGGEGETKPKADTRGGGKEGAETTERGGEVAIIFLIKKYIK